MAFAPSPLILANIFLPLNEALAANRRMEIEPKNNDGLVVLLATEECPVFVRQHVKEQSSRLGLQSITEEYIGEAKSYRYELISLLRDASIIVADITRDALACK